MNYKQDSVVIIKIMLSVRCLILFPDNHLLYFNQLIIIRQQWYLHN